MKRTLLFVTMVLLIGQTSMAQSTMPADIMVEDLHYVPCDTEVIEGALDKLVGDWEVVLTSEDESYFDIKRVPTTDDKITTSIRRTICFEFTVSSTDESDISKTRIWEGVTMTDQYWTDTSFGFGNLEENITAPGSSYNVNGDITFYINDYAELDEACIGVQIGLKDNMGKLVLDANQENNKTVLCSSISEYDFPIMPGNVSVTKAEDSILQFTWEDHGDADSYEVEGIDSSANADFRRLYPSSQTQNTATFTLPDDDFYCVRIWAKNGDIIGKKTDEFCYQENIRKFDDVPLQSWYFPYLQQLQANEMVHGYKDKNGYEIGLFGPADNLTNAEALKMGIEVIIKYIFDYDENLILPENLQNHWSAEYIRKGKSLNIDILEDLENFDPDQPITRGEVIHLFTQILDEVMPVYDELYFPDIQGYKYMNDIQYAYKRGFINGHPDGTFRPNNLLNRAEIVKIVNKFGHHYIWSVSPAPLIFSWQEESYCIFEDEIMSFKTRCTFDVVTELYDGNPSSPLWYVRQTDKQNIAEGELSWLNVTLYWMHKETFPRTREEAEEYFKKGDQYRPGVTKRVIDSITVGGRDAWRMIEYVGSTQDQFAAALGMVLIEEPNGSQMKIVVMIASDTEEKVQAYLQESKNLIRSIRWQQ